MKTTYIILVLFILILAFCYRFWDILIKKLKEDNENEDYADCQTLTYPINLKTNADIDCFIKKNRKQFPSEKQWDAILPNLINELSQAGWNTEMPIYTYENFGDYKIKVIANNQIIQDRLNQIIYKFSEMYN